MRRTQATRTLDRQLGAIRAQLTRLGYQRRQLTDALDTLLLAGRRNSAEELALRARARRLSQTIAALRGAVDTLKARMKARDLYAAIRAAERTAAGDRLDPLLRRKRTKSR